MVVAFDTDFLNAMYNANSSLSTYQELVRSIVRRIKEEGGLIIIPMPVWAEFRLGLRLANAKNYNDVKKEINGNPFFQIMPFDEKSAEFLIEATYAAHRTGDKRGGVENVWQKVKFDRQIVATAKAHGARIFYTNDKKQARFAENEFRLEVRDLDSLP